MVWRGQCGSRWDNSGQSPMPVSQGDGHSSSGLAGETWIWKSQGHIMVTLGSFLTPQGVTYSTVTSPHPPPANVHKPTRPFLTAPPKQVPSFLWGTHRVIGQRFREGLLAQENLIRRKEMSMCWAPAVCRDFDWSEPRL